MSPAVVGLQRVGYTRLRRCVFTDWLLQHCSCWCTKGSNVTSYSVCWTLLRVSSLALGSFTADWVRYCMTNFTGSSSPMGVFQAGSDSSPVSEWLRTAVPLGLLRSGLRCWYSAAPAFRQPSTTCSTSLPAQHLRPSGFFFQLPAPQSGTFSRISSGTRPSVQTVLGVCLKRFCLLDTSAFSVLKVLDDNRAL